METMKKWILLLLVAFVSVPGSAQSDWLRIISGMLKAGQAVTITDEQLAAAVKEEVAEMDHANRVCPPSDAYTKRLKRITSKMKSADGIHLNFKVYKTKDVNAFACPDGSVRVFSALMDVLNDDELAGVLGHEIGHVALRHSKKAWRSAMLRSAASDALGAVSSTWAGLSDSFIGDLSSLALSARHSRYHETQADEYGYEYLKKSGRNPWAMGLALIKLKKLSEGNSASKYEKWLQAFSSHPDFDARIENIRRMAKRDGLSVK